MSRRTTIVTREVVSAFSRATTVITLMPGWSSASKENLSLVGSAAFLFD